MPNFAAWWTRVFAHPDVVAVAGNVKGAAKPCGKPVLKAEEKKEAPKKAAAPKGGDEDDEDKPKKSEKNPLDLLPPTSFDLFNFKTFYVNHPDKKGAAIDEFMKLYDKEGWSIWFLHYEMYKGEGEVLYKTLNMTGGFIQRFEGFGKYSFARHCVLGTETKQEHMGVWMWRSTGTPQECIDHPTFEYMRPRRMDIFGNKEDEQLLRQFWGAEEGDIIMGMPVIQRYWQK